MRTFSKGLQLVAFAAAMAFLFGGCAGLAFSGHKTPGGFLFTDAKSNEQVTQNMLATKQGKSCATSILGWITTGDASVDTAAKTAGITQIASVDHSIKNYVGLFAEYCVIVTGQ